MAYAYFFTDYLKSDKEAFFKYILKNEELIDNLKDEDFSKYIEKQKNTAYSNNGEITISSAVGGIANEVQYADISNKILMLKLKTNL